MINKFDKEYSFLSNFSNDPVRYGNFIYPTSEHAFQAAKTWNVIERMAILSAPTPWIAKKLGRKVQLRNNWEEVKDSVMEEIIKNKFSTPELAAKLKSTGKEELIEGNCWHDNYWGSCSCKKCATIPGQNKLGKILMKIRSDL